jgi:hypothetical protein
MKQISSLVMLVSALIQADIASRRGLIQARLMRGR